MQRPKMFRLVLCSLTVIALVPAALWASDTPQPGRVGPVNPNAGLTLDDLSAAHGLYHTMALTDEGWLLAQATEEKQPADLEGADVLGYKPKSPTRAFLKSLIIPGWGQWYNGNRWKPFVFLGLETLGWVNWSSLRGKGKDLRDQYQVYADEHWTYDGYQNGLESVFHIDIDTLPYKLIEGDRYFSHHIYPDENGNFDKNETYYENLGKYDQFAYGWDDFPEVSSPDDTMNVKWVTPHRDDYLKQRNSSNREYSKASTVLILTIGNHLLSAFEAAWSARRYNRAIDQFGAIQPNLRLTQSETTGKLMPRLAVRYNF